MSIEKNLEEADFNARYGAAAGELRMIVENKRSGDRHLIEIAEQKTRKAYDIYQTSSEPANAIEPMISAIEALTKLVNHLCAERAKLEDWKSDTDYAINDIHESLNDACRKIDQINGVSVEDD